MKTVLVVDDEVSIAETLRMFLELHGYGVVTAYDGRDALRKALEEPPDLVVTDMMMPRMDGQELIEALAAAPGLAEVPVITMSANPQSTGRPFFRKPFDPTDLVAEIERAIGGADD